MNLMREDLLDFAPHGFDRVLAGGCGISADGDDRHLVAAASEQPVHWSAQKLAACIP